MRTRLPPTLYRAGRIYAAGSPSASALVVAAGTIRYIGTDAGARSAASGAPEVDLGGALVTPAFVDAHVHLIQTGLVMAGLDLRGAGSREQVLDALAEHLRRRPGTGAVIGHGWDERAWPDRRAPQRAELDRVAGAVPVYLARIDVHSAVVSSALLERLPHVRDLPGFDESGPLTRDAHHACRGGLDRLTGDGERRSAARAGLAAAARVGVGTVHELGGPQLGPLEDLVRVREEAAGVGLDVTTYWGELAGEAAFARARQVGAVGLAGDLCVDGAIGSHTAALREPYADRPGRGVRYLDDDEIRDHVVECTRAGLQAGFHCIGDDSVAAAVQGLRRAAEVVGSDELVRIRHRLEHVEMLAAGDIPTLAELGVVASMQPAFDAAWGAPGELYEQRLGRARAAPMNPIGSLLAAGVPVAFGSDAPVTPLAGWESVRAAVWHHNPAERVTVSAAFASATEVGHLAARGSGGVLRAGQPATFAVWDAPDGKLGPDGLPPLASRDIPLPAWRATLVRGRLAAGRVRRD